MLAVGIYDEPEDALTDLRDLTNPGPLSEVVAGAAVVTRGLTRAVMAQGQGGSTAYGIGTGAAFGVVVGVIVALPLVAAAAGAVIGGLVGSHLKKSETERVVALLADDLPIGATALIVVVPEDAQAEVRRSMARARKTTGRGLDDPDLRKLARGLVRGNPEATEALGGAG